MNNKIFNIRLILIMVITLFTSCSESIIEDLNKEKQKHAKRVAKLTEQLTYSEDIYNAAYYHDYLERVGNEEKLSDIVSPYSYKLITILTHGENDDVLESLEMKLENVNQKIIDDIVIIKISDRINNVNKRHKDKDLSKKYLKKSSELIQYLYDNYSGDKKELERFIKKNTRRKSKLVKRLVF